MTTKPTSSLARWLPAALVLLGLLLALYPLRSTRHSSDFHLSGFAEIPVQYNGRVQPLDSVAMNSLLALSGRRSLTLADGQRLQAIEWLALVAFDLAQADTLPVFRIDNDGVLGLFGWQQADRKRFSFLELQPHFEAIDAEAQAAFAKEDPLRSVFEKQLIKLHRALTLYHQLAHAFGPPGISGERLPQEYHLWQQVCRDVRESVRLQQEGQPHESAPLLVFQPLLARHQAMARLARVRVHPPDSPEAGLHDDWANLGETLLRTVDTTTLAPTAIHWADMAAGWASRDAARFNDALSQWLALTQQAPGAHKVAFEEFFNRLNPFVTCMALYTLAFVLVCLAWLSGNDGARSGAQALVVFTFLIHTFGLFARMYIQDRPPVTNLYSSAVFTGWGAALLGVFMERFWKNGLGSAVAAMVGFATLVIAHHLDDGSDTLELMRAVLDDNFWLATHVVVITLGYSAMFLAGTLGALYIVLGLGSRLLHAEMVRALDRMVYATLCFAALFSFVGTMLGGIWADQSWGRFWGWDPKENGALLIVLWTAIYLHVRWGALAGIRARMALAVFGNVVTAWSWFGTNMLGVGLHSYGFMDAAFVALTVFALSQMVLIALSRLPVSVWRSPDAAR